MHNSWILPKRLHSFSVYNICSHVYTLRKKSNEEMLKCTLRDADRRQILLEDDLGDRKRR